MIITYPIYFVEMSGDLKEEVSKLQNVIIASYEKHIDKTYVVLKASNNDETKEVIRYFHKADKKYKLHNIDVKYSKEGINFKVVGDVRR